MWWAIIKAALDKNNSPAWNRVNNVLSIWNIANSTSAKKASNFNDAVTNDGMYGSWGGYNG